MEFEVSNSKLGHFFSVLQLVKSQHKMPVKPLSHFLSLLNLLSRALGKVVRLMTRNLYSCLYPAYFSKECWAPKTTLSALAWEEMQFWESNIIKLNGFSISPCTPQLQPLR